jgi:hypothetical protein
LKFESFRENILNTGTCNANKDPRLNRLTPKAKMKVESHVRTMDNI